MQFKNADFERGIKQTITSLDGLKKALEINTNALDMSNIQRNVDSLNLTTITKSIEALTDRFSTMGIVGMAVIQRLTNSAINLAEKLSSVAIGQIMTGGKSRAQKVANARFQLDGLLHDAEKVQSAFDSASKAVDGTAYGLDAAVSTASQFASSGVQLGEEMDTALRGVAGLAAMTNTDFEYMGNIFATVAGNGRLMGMQLSQISAHGVNAAAVLGKALNKSEEEIRKMVSKGQISFKQFSDAMSEAFGDQAAKADSTLSGVLKNIKAQLSRIGEIFYGGIIENSDLIEFLGNVKKAVRSVVNLLKPLADPFKRIVSSVGHLGNSILGLFYNINDQEYLKSDKLTSIVTKIANIFDTIAGFIEDTANTINDFAEKSGIKKIADDAKEAATVVREATDEIRNMAKSIIQGDYGNGQRRKNLLGDTYQTYQDYVNAMYKANFDMAKADEIYSQSVTESTEKVVSAKEKERQAREDAIKAQQREKEQRNNIDLLKNAVSGIVTIIENFAAVAKAAGRAFKAVFTFKDAKKNFTTLLGSFNKLINSFKMTEERTLKLQTFFEGIFSIFKMVGDVLVNVVAFGFNTLSGVLPTVLDLILSIGEKMGSAIKKFREFFESNNLIVRAGRFIITTFTKVSAVLKEFFSRFVQLPAVQKLKDELIELSEKAIAKLIELFSQAKGALGDFFSSFNDADSSTMDKLLDGINSALEKMTELASDAKGGVTKFIAQFKDGGKLKDTATYLANVEEGYSKIKKTADAFSKTKNVADFVDNMRGAFGEGPSGGGGGGPVFSKAKTMIDDVTKSFANLDTAKLTLIGLSGVLTALTVSLSIFTIRAGDALKAFAELPRSITGAFKGIKGAFDGVRDYLNKKGTAKIITQAILALAALVAAIAFLAIVNKKYDLEPASKALTQVMLAMTAMIAVVAFLGSKASKSLTDAKKFNEMMDALAKIMLSTATAVFLVSAAMAVLSTITWDKNSFIGLAVLAGILAALVGVVAILGKLAPEIKTSGVWLIFYSGSVFLLVASLKRLAKLDIKGIQNKLLALAEAMAIVSMVAIASSRMSLGSGLSVLALVGSLVLIELALKWLIKNGITREQLKQSKDTLEPMFQSLAYLALYMIVVSNLCKNTEGMAKLVIALVISLFAITKTLQALAKLDAKDKLLGPVLSLVGIMLALTALIYIIGMAGQGNRIKQAGTAVIKIAVALGLMALVMTYLGVLKEETIAQGMAVLVQLVALMSVLIAVTHVAGKIDAKSFIAMIGVIATLAVLVALMSFIPDKMELLKAVGILGLALIAFGFAMFEASVRAKATASGPIERMILAVIVIAAMLIGLTYLNQGNMLSVLAAAAAMSMVLLALGECVNILMKSFGPKGADRKTMEKVEGVLLRMVLLVSIVGLALSALTFVSGGKVGSILASAAAIILILGSLTGIMYFLSHKMKGGSQTRTVNNRINSIHRLLIELAAIALALTPILIFGKNGEQIANAGLAVVAILFALAGVYYALANINGDPKDMQKKALALAAVSLALIPIAFALSMLTSLNWDSMWPAVVGLSLMLVAITGALAGLIAISKSGTGLAVLIGVTLAVSVVAIALAGSAYILAKAISIMVGAFKNLATVPFDKISKNMPTLFKLLAFVAGVAVAGGIAGIALISIGIGMASVGAALFIIASAIALVLVSATGLVTASTLLVNALTKFVVTIMAAANASQMIANGIDIVGKAIVRFLTNFAVAFANSIVKFLLTLTSKAVVIGTALKLFILTVIDIVMSARREIFGKVLDGLIEFFQMLNEKLPVLFDEVNKVVIKCLEAIADQSMIWGYYGAVIAARFVAGLCYGLGQSAEDLVDSAIYMCIKIVKAIDDTFEKYKDSIGHGVSKGFDSFSMKLWQGIADHTTGELSDYAQKNADTMREEMEYQNAEFNKEWDEIEKRQEEKQKNRGDSSARAFGIGYSTGMQGTTHIVTKSVEGMSSQAISALKAEGWKLNAAGNEMYKEVYEGASQASGESGGLIEAILGGNTEDAKEATSTAAAEIKDKFVGGISGIPTEVSEAMSAQGFDTSALTENINGGIEETAGDLSFDPIGNEVDLNNEESGLGKIFSKLPGDLKDKAVNGANEFVNGIVGTFTSDDTLTKVGDASSGVADEIKDKFNLTMKIESPSKEAIKSSNYWIDGLLIPLNTRSSELSVAAINNAHSILDGFDSEISNSDTAFTPTIRPVLDTNNMGQYSGFMDILNNPATVQLAADSQLTINNTSQMRLAQQIEGLRQDINKMANQDLSKIMDGVNINVNANTTVDGHQLRKTSAQYTIGQINKQEMGYAMATGGRL